MNNDSLIRLVEENLEDSSLFLVAVKLSESGDHRKIKVILDGDNGVTIDQCAALSRKISLILDEDETFSNPFVLEVTSPGIDHPLELFRQYEKNVGRNVRVVLKDKTEKKGKLTSVNKEFIEVQPIDKSKKKVKNNELVEIPFSQIVRTNIQISFK